MHIASRLNTPKGGVLGLVAMEDDDHDDHDMGVGKESVERMERMEVDSEA
jgi:hypothetical protein